MRASSVSWIAALVALTMGSTGCVSEPDVGTQSAAVTADTAFANDQAAYDFFVGKGLTSFQAAGIVGNLDQESGVDPGAVQYGGGPGRGIAQWSVGGRWDSSYHDNVLWYAGQQGQASGSLNLQLEFIWYELTNLGYGFNALEATTNVTDATVVFMDDYEICGQCDQSQRVAYAQSVLNAYGTPPPYGAKFVSQSWPYASMPAFQVKCGESLAATIVLKNTGSKPWDSSTRLGTTEPRDRPSIFAGSDWVGPNRAAQIQGSVAPGQKGTFAFSFDGPTGDGCVPGMYDEHFGLVQEGVTWFSDQGQGGPPDDQIEALIELVPGDPGTGSGTGSGTGTGTGSGTGSGAGSGAGSGNGLQVGGGGGCDAGGGAGGGCVILLACALRPRRRRLLA